MYKEFLGKIDGDPKKHHFQNFWSKSGAYKYEMPAYAEPAQLTFGAVKDIGIFFTVQKIKCVGGYFI